MTADKINTLPMCDTKCGQKFIIHSISDALALKKRLCDMGITAGTVITPLFDSPLGDLTAYRVRNTVVAIRSCDSRKIEVYPI